MAHFSKDVYEGKQRYAWRIARDNYETVQNYLMTLDDSLDVEDDAKVFEELSTARHEMHSTQASLIDDDLFDDIGNEYTSEDSILSKVWDVIDKYNIPIAHPKMPKLPEIFFFEPIEEWLDYFGTEDEEEALDLLREKWIQKADEYSEYLREWFYEFNQLTGANFPDKES